VGRSSIIISQIVILDVLIALTLKGGVLLAGLFSTDIVKEMLNVMHVMRMENMCV
jgi:hypothetical protein